MRALAVITRLLFCLAAGDVHAVAAGRHHSLAYAPVCEQEPAEEPSEPNRPGHPYPPRPFTIPSIRRPIRERRARPAPLFSCGANAYGQLGIGDDGQRPEFNFFVGMRGREAAENPET